MIFKWLFSHKGYTPRTLRRKWNKVKLLTVKPTCMYTHAPTAEIQNNPLACSPQSDSCVCLLSAPALQTQMSKPMQKSQQNGTVGLLPAHCLTTMYKKKPTIANDTHDMRRRVTARLVTVQASNTEAVWMITSAPKHFQPRTHTFSQCTCWGTATLHSLADCSEAAARSLCEGEAFQMQIYTLHEDER